LVQIRRLARSGGVLAKAAAGLAFELEAPRPFLFTDLALDRCTGTLRALFPALTHKKAADIGETMEQTFKLDAASEAARIVTVTDRIFILLDGLPEPAVKRATKSTCPSCGTPIKAWDLFKELAARVVACACVTALVKPPYWAAKSIVDHWKVLIQIRDQLEQASSKPPR
jgi:hypothetical protein